MAGGDRCRAASGAQAVVGPALRVHLPPDSGLLAARRVLTHLLTTALDDRGRTWTAQPSDGRSADVLERSCTCSILLRIRRLGVRIPPAAPRSKAPRDHARGLFATTVTTTSGPEAPFLGVSTSAINSRATSSPRLSGIPPAGFSRLARLLAEETAADATRPARLGLAGLFGHGADEETALTVGAFYQALLSGLAAQAMADPASVPSGRDLLDAVRTVAARLGAGEAGTRTG